MKPLKALISKNTIKRAHAGVKGFFKEKLTCGTVVMFGDETLGVYVNGDLADKMWEKFDFGNRDGVGDGFFLCHSRRLMPCYLGIDMLTHDLHEISFDPNCEIIRIYDKKLKSNDIEHLDKRNLVDTLNDFIKSSKYVNRHNNI